MRLIPLNLWVTCVVQTNGVTRSVFFADLDNGKILAGILGKPDNEPVRYLWVSGKTVLGNKIAK